MRGEVLLFSHYGKLFLESRGGQYSSSFSTYQNGAYGWSEYAPEPKDQSNLC